MTRGAPEVKPDGVKDDASGDSEAPPDPSNRRGADRFAVQWSVDCETEDTFLYASIRNISELGIFVATREPLGIGTKVTLRFAPQGVAETFVVSGVVQWINPVRLLSENRNPGMGVRFVELSGEDRERLVDAIRTIAYVRDASN
ncbi:MAG TPA: TIGR02266 family protein [Polyangiaceae bacterium]|nr:TIGR02266 family protein [Polyangiaceae bacterium]